MRRSLGMNILCQKKTIFQPVKYGSLSTSALTVVETASISVLYTQKLWRTQELHIRFVILVFLTTPIFLMSVLCCILFTVDYGHVLTIMNEPFLAMERK